MGVDLVEVVGGQCRLSYGFVKARLKYSDGRENTWDKIPQQDYIKKKKTLQDRFSTVSSTSTLVLDKNTRFSTASNLFALTSSTLFSYNLSCSGP